MEWTPFKISEENAWLAKDTFSLAKVQNALNTSIVHALHWYLQGFLDKVERQELITNFQQKIFS